MHALPQLHPSCSPAWSCAAKGTASKHFAQSAANTDEAVGGVDDLVGVLVCVARHQLHAVYMLQGSLIQRDGPRFLLLVPVQTALGGTIARFPVKNRLAG